MSNNILLTVYTYVDGVSDTPFPNAENPLKIKYTYNAQRMGSSSLTATAMYPTCLDDLWVSGKQYVDFKGERYFIVKTPSSSKSNDDVRYKHELEFLSGRSVLDNVYVYDVVTGDAGNTDRYVSNSTKVLFYGDIQEFVARLNFSLEYSNLAYRIVIDEGITSEAKQVSLENMFFSNALQEIFNIFELPFYFVGTTIHVGFTNNAITHTFKYGKDFELLSVSKTNANYKITNRVTGTGSSDNIQFYYPNPSNDRKAIEEAGGTWITPSQVLMPPIYRQTNGAERFYNALNNKYINPDTGDYYTFENLYLPTNPKEQIVDFSYIKPSIKNALNKAGVRMDIIKAIAFDQNDDDSINKDTGEYVHSYFYVKLNKFDGDFGFNLFDQALVGSDATISMTSGACGACNFQIGVTEVTQEGKQVFRNPVQVDSKGDIVPGDYAQKVNVNNLQPQQQNTMTNEVWIALKKDNTTFGIVMPNAGNNIKPSAGDSFVFLNIDMPQAYITKAEKELEEAIIKYMANNNREKFTFSIKLSRIFLAENPSIGNLLNENARINLEYNGQFHQLYVSNYTLKVDENVLPEISIQLTDTLTIGKNSLQTAIDGVKQDIMNSIGSVDFLKQGLKYFLRKDTSDYARDFITFLRGLKVGSYTEGGNSGGIFAVDANGKTYIETDMLKVRAKAYFETLEIINTNSIGGRQIITPGGSITCNKVVEGDTYYRCYFVNDADNTPIENRFKVDDQALSQDFNIKEGIYENVSNHYYWRKVVAIGDDYIDLSKTDADVSSDVPKAGDVICQLGNKTDKTRQNAIIFSAVDFYSPSITLYAGIDNYSYVNKEYVSYGVDKTTNEAFFNVYGRMYVGDRNKTSYMQYSEKDGLQIKGKLQIGTTIGSGQTVEDALEQTKNDAIAGAKENLDEFATIVNGSLGDLQDQIDGAIETWFYDPVPTLTNQPAVNWTTNKDKNTHLGDLYYDSNGKAYRFQLTGTKYEWKVLTDSDITKALADAKKAQDTADSKRKIFVRQPLDTETYEVGDLWVNATFGSTYSNDVLRCKTAKAAGTSFSINHWEKASKYTDDQAALEAQAAAAKAAQDAANAQATADAAKDRLNTWADDGFISPTEKPALVDEQKRIEAEYLQIKADADRYGILIPQYTEAKTNYVAELTYHTKAIPENIAVRPALKSTQIIYYDRRNGALNQIAAAAKSAADSAKESALEAQRLAKAAQADVDQAKRDINGLDGEVDGLRNFTDQAFKDGVIDRSEATAIAKYLNNIKTSQKDVSQSFAKVYNNPLLSGIAKTNLNNANIAFNTAATDLISTIRSAIADGITTNTEKAAVDDKYSVFNTKYGDYIAYLNEANKFIQDQIKTTADNALQKAVDLDYLKQAFTEKTTITDGIVQTSILALGYTDGSSYKIMSGSNGIYNSSKIGGGIASWWGGSMKDRNDYTSQNMPADVAKGLVRFDGTGYFANGNLWWDNNGKLHADPLSFFVGPENVGDLLSIFQIVKSGTSINYVVPRYPFQKLSISSYLELGSGYRIKVDEANNAIYVEKDGGGIVNFYATGGITALGVGTKSPQTILDALPIDTNTLSKEGGKLTVIGGGSGGNTGAISLNGQRYDSVDGVITLPNLTTPADLTSALNAYATQSWVTDKNYATQSWVNGKGYVTATALATMGFATQAWVNSQGFLKSNSLDNYVTLNTIQNITAAKTFQGGIVSTTFRKSDGTASQFLKADGSIDSNTYAKLTDVSNIADVYFKGQDIYSDYGHWVVGLIRIGTVDIGDKYISGEMIYRRSNGIYSNGSVRFNLIKKYNSTKMFAGVFYTGYGVYPDQEAPRLCTFTYLGVKWGGLCWRSASSLNSIKTIIYDNSSTDTPFYVKYFNSQSSEIQNAEINNSISVLGSDIDVQPVSTNGRFYTSADRIEINNITNGWSYIRYRTNGIFYDVGLSGATAGMSGAGNFEIRPNGSDNQGVFVRYYQSDYGKLGVVNRSGQQCSISYFNNAPTGDYPLWTVGAGIRDQYSFDWWYHNQGYKATLDSEGKLFVNVRVAGNPYCSLTIGDYDTGLSWVSDGVIGFRSNAKDVGFWSYTNGRLYNCYFREPTGNEFAATSMMVNGNGSNLYPGIGFHQPGVIAGVVYFTNSGEFKFRNITDTGYTNVYGGNLIADAGFLYSRYNGIEIKIGAENDSYVHFITKPARSLYFANSLFVNGSVLPYSSSTYSLGDAGHLWNYVYGSHFMGNSASATYILPNYVGGQQANPQTYFNNSMGVKVAMTGVNPDSYWGDTLWINGYAGADVPDMCALHFSRGGAPLIYISSQKFHATSYGTMYHIWTGYNSNHSSAAWTCSTLNARDQVLAGSYIQALGGVNCAGVINSGGCSGFNVYATFHGNGQHGGIEIGASDNVFGIGVHSNDHMYWWWTNYGSIGSSSNKSYIMDYGEGSWRFTGNILATGGVTAKTTSDMRLKNKIGNSNYIEKLLSLGLVFDYTYNDIAKSRVGKMVDNEIHTGLSYQDVSKVLPAICGKDDDGYGYINYISPDFISLIAGATQLNTLGIKELYKKTNSIEDEIKKLKKENECLKKEINKLKREYR